MTTETKPSVQQTEVKASLAEAKKVYRNIYEDNVSEQLHESKSRLLSNLTVEEYLTYEGNNDLSPALPINAKIKLTNGSWVYLPVSLPINFKEKTREKANKHNVVQIYLNDIGDKKIEKKEIGKYFSLSEQTISDLLRSGFSDALLLPPSLGNQTIDNFSISKNETVRNKFKIRGQSEFQKREVESKEVLDRLLNPEVPIEEKRRLIKTVSRGIYQTNNKIEGEKAAVFISLDKLARKYAGLFPRNRNLDIEFLAKFIEKLGKPVGIFDYEVKFGKQKGISSYHFALFSDAEEIGNLLKETEDTRIAAMRVNPVEVMGPNPKYIPTTANLKNKEVYTSVFKLLEKFGIKTPFQLSSLGLNMENLIGSPSEFTCYNVDLNNRKGFYIDKNDIPSALDYLDRRLTEHGITG